MSEVGHNSAPVVAVDALRAYFERLQRVEEEKKELSADMADIRAEAKAQGYNMKAFAKAYSLWKLEREERAMIALYAGALGILE